MNIPTYLCSQLSNYHIHQNTEWSLQKVIKHRQEKLSKQTSKLALSESKLISLVTKEETFHSLGLVSKWFLLYSSFEK